MPGSNYRAQHREKRLRNRLLPIVLFAIVLSANAAGTAVADEDAPLVSAQAEAKLRQAVTIYGQQVSAPAPGPIPSGPLIEPAARDSRVRLVRLRLAGDDNKSGGGDDQGRDHRVPNNMETEYYDGPLQQRVRAFQARHGLLPDGRLDSKTIDALNVPVQARVAQLQLNLERLKKLRRSVTAARYILVNIPALELTAVKNGRVELTSTVIVGRPDRPTPQLNATIRAVNIHPSWHVPSSIVKSDLFRKFSEDPKYFERRDFLVFGADGSGPIDPASVISRGLTDNTVRLVQKPGPMNALGRIRIDMPNPYSVYLHDTPIPRLFGWPGRLFSAGCVRVARIVELAAWLIAENEPANLQPVSDALRDAAPQTFKLSKPVPVHFVYQTAWVGADGVVNFRPDVYERFR